jgi:hypothetical protein
VEWAGGVLAHVRSSSEPTRALHLAPHPCPKEVQTCRHAQRGSRSSWRSGDPRASAAHTQNPGPPPVRMHARMRVRAQVPIEFEFEIRVARPHPCFSVAPMRGVVPALGHVTVEVTFAPTALQTEEATIEVRGVRLRVSLEGIGCLI